MRIIRVFSYFLAYFLKIFYDGLAPAEASRTFPFQFGSISPGLMNGVQVDIPRVNHNVLPAFAPFIKIF